jgi:cytochrome P450
MTEPVAQLPMERTAECPFDPPPELAAIRAEAPLRRLTFADGHLGWLATGHAASRAILGDVRFSSRVENMHNPFPGLEIPEDLTGAVGDMTAMDRPEHTRFRQLLTGKFTVRRMRLLTERVEQVTAECLDAMAAQGPPADLVTAFAQPIPAAMICELLGVPAADHDAFKRMTADLGGLDVSVEEQYAAYGELQQYIHELVKAKRAEPTDDVLSDLTTSDLTHDELAGVGAFLLGAGLDTTANMLGLGTFALLTNPDQFAALRDDPALTDAAVEEFLRYLSIAHTGVRTALADVEVDGQVIRTGESVVVSVMAANRDPERFPDPDRLDVHRKATGHLAFGHGIHQCLGQQLARVEMRVAFPALLARFPTLRLAGSVDDVILRPAINIHGIKRLPVAWDA